MMAAAVMVLPSPTSSQMASLTGVVVIARSSVAS